MFWIIGATIMVSLAAGAHGNCHREGTKLKCTGTFKGRPFAVKTDVKVCHNPVETDIEFKILNKIYTKHYTGNQDFYLQRLSIDRYERKAYLLNVNVKPLSNGDRKITICMKERSFDFPSIIKITVLGETVITPDCSVAAIFLISKGTHRGAKLGVRYDSPYPVSPEKEILMNLKSAASSSWWNSQTLAIKITIGAVAILLLIILILSILYCCFRRQNSERQETAKDKLPVVEEKGVVIEKQPVDVDTKKSKIPEPDENQFKYTLHINDVA